MKPRSFSGFVLAIIAVMAAFLFSQNEARAAIAVTQVTRAVTTTAAATQATAAFTPVADTLYLMWTIQTIGAGPPTVPTATCANGLAMVQVNTITFATTATQLKRLTLFRALKPSGLVNGACTITWGQTTTGHGHVIVRFTGVDSSGTDGSGAVVQSVTGRTNSATAATGLSLTLAALQAGSTTAGGFSNAVNNASSLAAGAGYTVGTGGAFNTPPTSIRAEWRIAGSTTVNMTQSATSHIGGIAVEVKPKPTTTLATGTDPAAATIAPGVTATDVDQFTLQTSSGTEAITSVTVNLSTNSGVGLLAITSDDGSVVLGSTASPVAGANTITVAGMNANTTLTAFKVRVTPLSHAAMPAPNGAAYAITAPVTAWAGPNTHAGSDTNPNALTIDNLSPAGATAVSGSAGDAQVTLNWTTSAAADFSRSVMLRWTGGTAGAEVPAEGIDYANGGTIGTATVACVRTADAASTAVSGVDGAGSGGCSATALSNGQAYTYRIFQKDTRGNYDTGVAVGTFTTTYPVPTTTSISPTSKALGAAMFTLTVNGTNFTPGSVVRFNGSDRTTSYVSSTQLTATIPATDLTVVGTFPITVFNPTPGGGLSNAQTFTVSPAPPSAVTNAASGVTSAVATLNGTVGSNGASTTVVFEWGLTAAYGETITATQSPLAAGSPPYPAAAVSAVVEGVNCNTVFHYRVTATNSAGTTNGVDGTFTTGACSAPFPVTACAATRYNGDLGCSAADVGLTNIALAPSSIASCVSGTPVTLDLDLTVNFSSPNRYDVGIFIANDGKLPTLLPANGGASSCSVAVLPIVPETGSYTFPDLDGVPQGTADTCGDGNSSINGGTGAGVKRMTNVTLPCYASAGSGGKLFVPFAISWDSQRSPIGNLCTSNLYPVPVTSSKCNAPLSSVNINIVVLPVITKTNGGTQISPGANTAYTVVITNNSGGTLLDTIFTDTAVSNLSVTSMSCAAAAGATCPAMTSAAMISAMQGAGITIASASLPNNGYLTFTINATVSGGATIGSHIVNTATVNISGSTTSAADDDLVVLAPSAAKSFAPSTITEDAASVLTVTLTNPSASAITGATFVDSYPSGLVNTAAAGGATTCGGTVTAANGGNSLELSGGTIPASGSCTVTVNVTSATVGSYSNSTGTVTHGAGTIAAASAILTVNAAVYGGFNACDVAAAPNASCTNTTTPATSHITTKIAGSSFNLDLVALKTDGTRQTNYNNKDVIVELLDASNNSGALDAYNCRSTWTTFTPPMTLSPNPTFVSNGLVTVGPFIVAEAYRDVRVRVTNSGGATKKGCSTDNFAIRPNSLAVAPTDSTWESAGLTRPLTNTDVSGGNVHKAGRPFTITATAKNASNVTTTNYNVAVAPTAALSACSPGTACTASFGTLTPGTPAFSAGAVSWNSATYSEAGAYDLALQDTDFTSVDASDSAATCAGRYVCGAASVGRFVPDHFAITSPGLTASCTTGTAFSYFGQDGFTTDFTITAENAGNQTVTKYAGAWAKLPLTAWGAAPASAGSPGFGFAAATLPVWSTLAASATPPVGSWSNGVGTFTTPPKHQASRPSPAATPAAPTTVAISAHPVDADGVTMPAAAALGNVLLRFGILRLDNAYGSELLPIRVTARAMYCNAVSGANCTEWRTNTDDACTSFGAGLASMNNYIAPQVPALAAANFSVASNWNASQSATSPIANGIGTLVFDKPTCAAAPCPTGSVDLTLNLATNNLSWLLGNWTSTGTWNENPKARLKFGSPKAPYIYLRERY